MYERHFISAVSRVDALNLQTIKWRRQAMKSQTICQMGELKVKKTINVHFLGNKKIV